MFGGIMKACDTIGKVAKETAVEVIPEKWTGLVD
jgi:hypothetical protein